MRKDDLVRVRHMLDAAKEALSFADGKRRQDLDISRMLVLSLVQDIMIVGEAASKVSLESRQTLAQFRGRILLPCGIGSFTAIMTSISIRSGTL